MALENNTTNDEIIGPTTSSLIDEVLTKYNLNKSPAEEADQIMSGGNLPISIIVQALSKNFSNNLISEKDFVTSLVNKLNISNEIAQNIVRDISDKVVPYIKSLPKSRPIPVEQIPPVRAEAPEYNLNTQFPPKPEITKEAIKKVPTFTPKPQPNISKPKGPDSYREPIE